MQADHESIRQADRIVKPCARFLRALQAQFPKDAAIHYCADYNLHARVIVLLVANQRQVVASLLHLEAGGVYTPQYILNRQFPVLIVIFKRRFFNKTPLGVGGPLAANGDMRSLAPVATRGRPVVFILVSV